MPPFQTLPPQQQESSNDTSVPLIKADQRRESAARQADPDDTSVYSQASDVDTKPGQRSAGSLGRQKEEMETTSPPGMLPHTQAAIGAMQSTSPAATKHLPSDLKPQQGLSSPRHPYPSMASPSRLRSSSPRLHSPASSEIFERNVQEPVPISTLQGEMDPAHIATHVITEDHIPPALEASAQAITSGDLNVDEVEIVMSASHQPAAASVLESSTSHADLTQLHKQPPSLPHYESAGSEPSSMQQSGISPPATNTTTNNEEEGASNYGELDPNDFRRLSFISFADVVQSEHQQQAGSSALAEAGSRDSLHIGSNNFPPSIASVQHQQQQSSQQLPERAASPFRSSTQRSPANSTSGGVTTPPLGSNANANEQSSSSPVRSNPMVAGGGLGHGELHIETMRQAVRKTASGDLSGVRSTLASPVSNSDEVSTRSRGNT